MTVDNVQYMSKFGGMLSRTLSDLSSVPDSEEERMPVPTVASSSKRKAGDIDASFSDTPEPKAPAKKAKKGKKKLAVRKGKKKSVVPVSERVDSDEVGPLPVPQEDSIPTIEGGNPTASVLSDEAESVPPPRAGKEKAPPDAEEPVPTPPKSPANSTLTKTRAPATVAHSSDEDEERANPPSPRPSSTRRKSANITQSTLGALINKVNSLPNTPGHATTSCSSHTRSALSKIAPLHASRKEPPKALPKPPPPKKSKKMLELEEKWEDELKDEYEDRWLSMEPQERATLRVAKQKKEMGYESY